MIIEIDGSVKHQGKVSAVYGVSFEVGEGEVFRLLGLNVAGKTMLMEILCGLRKFERGIVRISGFDLVKDSRKARALVGFCSTTDGCRASSTRVCTL